MCQPRKRSVLTQWEKGHRQANGGISAMKWSTAWKWMLGLLAAILAAQAYVFQSIFSIVLFLAVFCAILFSLALFSVASLEVIRRGLDFLEPCVRTAVDRTRTIVAPSVHPLPACVDPRQGLFLVLPTLARGIAGNIQNLRGRICGSLSGDAARGLFNVN